MDLDQLRKSAGFYDNNENQFDAAPMTAGEIPDELLDKKTWIYDHLNASIVGLDIGNLTDAQLRDILKRKLDKSIMQTYHDNIHFVAEKELNINRHRHWSNVHVIFMSIDALAKQIKQFYKNTSMNYF